MPLRIFLQSLHKIRFCFRGSEWESVNRGRWKSRRNKTAGVDNAGAVPRKAQMNNDIIPLMGLVEEWKPEGDDRTFRAFADSVLRRPDCRRRGAFVHFLVCKVSDAALCFCRGSVCQSGEWIASIFQLSSWALKRMQGAKSPCLYPPRGKKIIKNCTICYWSVKNRKCISLHFATRKLHWA